MLIKLFKYSSNVVHDAELTWGVFRETDVGQNRIKHKNILT